MSDQQDDQEPLVSPDQEADRQNRISTSNQGSNTTQQVETTYTSQLSAFFIIVNVTIGAGILAIPASMNTAGLITSLITQVVFLIAIIVTVIICTELTVKTNVNSFHEIIEKRCHRYLYIYTQISILLISFGAFIAYLVIIGDQSDRLLSLLYKDKFCSNTFYMTRRFVMSMVTFVFIKPLCSAKTVDFLKYGSFVGVSSLGFICFMVIREFIKQGHIADNVQYFPVKFTDIGQILPVFCIAYQCHLSWVPIAATIRKEEKYTSYKTVTIAMIVSAVIYSMVCVFALLTLGNKIEDDLTESYADNDWILKTTIALIAIKSVVTIPALFLPARLSIMEMLKRNSQTYAGWSETAQRLSVTLPSTTLSLTLALSVPSIQTVVNFLGCLAVMFIFTLPGLAYLHQIDENRMLKQQEAGLEADSPLKYSLKDKFKRWLSYFFIVFGIIMMAVVLYKSIASMNGSSKTPLCPDIK